MPDERTWLERVCACSAPSPAHGWFQVKGMPEFPIFEPITHWITVGIESKRKVPEGEWSFEGYVVVGLATKHLGVPGVIIPDELLNNVIGYVHESEFEDFESMSLKPETINRLSRE